MVPVIREIAFPAGDRAPKRTNAGSIRRATLERMAIVWRPRDATFYYLVTSSGERDGAALASGILRRLRPSR